MPPVWRPGPAVDAASVPDPTHTHTTPTPPTPTPPFRDAFRRSHGYGTPREPPETIHDRPYQAGDGVWTVER
jgi:hypothetical protein